MIPASAESESIFIVRVHSPNDFHAAMPDTETTDIPDELSALPRLHAHISSPINVWSIHSTPSAFNSTGTTKCGLQPCMSGVQHIFIGNGRPRSYRTVSIPFTDTAMYFQRVGLTAIPRRRFQRFLQVRIWLRMPIIIKRRFRLDWLPCQLRIHRCAQ